MYLRVDSWLCLLVHSVDVRAFVRQSDTSVLKWMPKYDCRRECAERRLCQNDVTRCIELLCCGPMSSHFMTCLKTTPLLHILAASVGRHVPVR